MKNVKKENILITLIGVVGFVCFLTMYVITAVKSFEYDGYGFSISYGNREYFVLVIIFLVVMILGIIRIVNNIRKVTYRHLDGMMLLLIGLIGASFYLSSFINNVANQPIDPISVTYSLALSLISILVSGLAVLLLLKKK
ncbi:MAG: hypothetical protein GXY57_01755 [Erysipelotrichaceae bacterium]|nr:hypothetical protein [Erysipelotrichaceae bacterium]